MSEFITVYVTVSSETEGTHISRALVEEHLAACVNVIPGVRSFYRWEGTVADDPELLLIIKSRSSRLTPLITRIKELHSYDVPEVIALPIQGGSDDYLDWVRTETTPVEA